MLIMEANRKSANHIMPIAKGGTCLANSHRLCCKVLDFFANSNPVIEVLIRMMGIKPSANEKNNIDVPLPLCPVKYHCNPDKI